MNVHMSSSGLLTMKKKAPFHGFIVLQNCLSFVIYELLIFHSSIPPLLNRIIRSWRKTVSFIQNCDNFVAKIEIILECFIFTHQSDSENDWKCQRKTWREALIMTIKSPHSEYILIPSTVFSNYGFINFKIYAYTYTHARNMMAFIHEMPYTYMIRSGLYTVYVLLNVYISN